MTISAFLTDFLLSIYKLQADFEQTHQIDRRRFTVKQL